MHIYVYVHLYLYYMNSLQLVNKTRIFDISKSLLPFSFSSSPMHFESHISVAHCLQNLICIFPAVINKVHNIQQFD